MVQTCNDSNYIEGVLKNDCQNDIKVLQYKKSIKRYKTIRKV